MKRTSVLLLLKDFFIWYCIFFFADVAINTSDVFLHITTYYMPAIASLFGVLFFSKNAIWPVYKKGDNVWWSTYGEDQPIEKRYRSQKLVFRFIIAYCFMFTLLIFNKKAPIYLSVKDYIVPAVFGLGIILIPVLYGKSEKTSESPS